MSSEQKPSINEQGIVTLIHILGGIFYFLPALIGFFVIDNLSESAKNSIKIALNYQLTVTLLFIILSAAGTLLGILGLLIWFVLSIIPLANFIISLLAGLSYYNNGTLKYPPYFEFIK
jgi:uncharacterized Tic20 family protein